MTISVRKPRRRHHAIMFPHWENVINEFMNTGLNDLASNKHLNYTLPAVNISENDTGFTLELTIPGLAKEDIQLQVEKDYLIISAEKNIEDERKFRLREFKYGVFKRKFYLSDQVDTDKIEATYNQGILSIFVPKREKIELKKTIKIS